MIMCLSTKGQVTIPQEIREKAGIGPGSAVEIEYRDGTVVLKPCPESVANRPNSFIEKLRGSATIRMSTDEIMSLTRGDE
jgi:AbrB family looped-hinge helix DNA binding protein